MRLLALVASVLGGLLPGDRGRDLHPQDGPDADVRITIGRSDVKITITVNLLFADLVVGVLRENRDRLDPVEHDTLHEALFEHFNTKHEVSIDGKVVSPVDEGFGVEPPDQRLLPLFPLFGMRAMTKVRLQLAYAADASFEDLTVRWASFPPDLALDPEDGQAPPVSVAASTLAEGKEDRVTFRVDEPVYEWNRSRAGRAEFAGVPLPAARPTMRVPVVTVLVVAAWGAIALLTLLFAGSRAGKRVLVRGGIVAVIVGAACFPLRSIDVAVPFTHEELPDEAQERKIFEALHTNVYRAFDFGTEDEIYDALARSVHGKLLEELYASIYNGLVMREEGGAVSRVKNVDLKAVSIAPSTMDDGHAAFDVDASWSVYGEVYHWGHGHNQTNEYEARFRVANTGDAWRIVSYVPKSSRTLEKTDLRTFGSQTAPVEQPTDSSRGQGR
ncbi:MAG: hypothetical protein H6832_07345 [Planctomycetes bacterium]|nr:hypothetical protein [Planctomycetota bacterium]MCB9918202.1 hypothetical protein [Planctomycetota bacterium]